MSRKTQQRREDQQYDPDDPFKEVPDNLLRPTSEMFAAFGLRVTDDRHGGKRIETMDFDPDGLSDDLHLLAQEMQRKDAMFNTADGAFLTSLDKHAKVFESCLLAATANGSEEDGAAPENVLRESLEPMGFALDLAKIMQGTMTALDPYFDTEGNG